MDPLGKLLRHLGAIDDDALADVLAWQAQPLRLASLCYALGHVDEAALVRALSRQAGMPGVVLDESVIRLSCLAGLPVWLLLDHTLLPVYEDDARIFVATEALAETSRALRQVELHKGKRAVPHVALQITLARTLRACVTAAEQGETYYVGPRARPEQADARGAMVVVSEVRASPDSDPEARAQEAVIEDVTKEIVDAELIPIDEADAATGSITTQSVERVDESSAADDAAERRTDPMLGELAPLPGSPEEDDALGGGADRRSARARVVLVDDDTASRSLVVKELEPAGFEVEAYASGRDAVRRLRESPPDLVIADVMLPEIGGLEICRTIKQSERYGDIPVILVSAVLGSDRLSPEVLERYGADDYFEKPLDVASLSGRAGELVGTGATRARSVEDDGSFERAMDLYRDGQVDDAVSVLRTGVEIDPLSVKHHFALGNLLQKQERIYEAIDAYETTVELKPDYFPALTRLAYLYYTQGFAARAIDAWRRSLPHCPDSGLRENIEIFMRKLIAEMQTS